MEERKNRRLMRRQALERKLSARHEKDQVGPIVPPHHVERFVMADITAITDYL